MNDQDQDRIFDENLRKIAPHLSIPTEPTPEQRQRWKHPPHTPAAPRATVRLRRALWAMATVSGVAAIIMLALWLVPSDRTASAQAVLASLRTSLARPMWIELRDIDLGSVSVSGTVFLDSREGQPQFLKLDAIIHPDSDLWSDMRATAISAKSSGSTWLLTRTGPASVNGQANRLQPPVNSQLDMPADWAALWLHPEKCFGGIPTVNHYDSDGKPVTYRLSMAARAVVGMAIRDLVMLSSERQSVEELISSVRAVGDDLSVTQQADDAVILTARNLSFFTPPERPSVAFDLILRYDPVRQKVLDLQGEGSRPDTIDGVRLGEHFVRPIPLDELLIELRSQSASVEVDRSKSPWLIRVRQMKAKPWLLESLSLASLDRIDLTIEFDPQRRAVTRAVMSNVGATSGKIILRFDGAPPQRELLEPAYWTRADTAVHDREETDE